MLLEWQQKLVRRKRGYISQSGNASLRHYSPSALIAIKYEMYKNLEI